MRMKYIVELLNRAVYTGVRRENHRVDDALKVINSIALGAIIINAIFFINFLAYQFMYSGRYYYNSVLNVFFIAGLLSVFSLTVRGKHLQAAFLIWILGLCMTAGLSILFYGPETGSHYYIIAFFPLSVLIFMGNNEFRYAIGVNIVNYLIFIYCNYILKNPMIEVLDENVDKLSQNITNITGTIILISILVAVFLYNLNKARRQLEAEHERANGLLLNILPEPIAIRLMANETDIADGFTESTVLFSDMVGFTEIASDMEPDELVRLLNRLFSKYDELSVSYGIEKIKTIGDSYMAASGVPLPRKDHAEMMCAFALDMLRATEEIGKETGYDLKIRIGINSGTVVAGVIGEKKFIYDLWGDTVNVASRMESHGLPGYIQVSQRTYDLVCGRFDLEPRGEIQIKGKGSTRTYLLKGKL